jgi:RNA polymerase sigma-70 factor, ECF subfamily
VDVQDAAAFEACYVAHRRHVLAYCLRRAHRSDAEEAADETFLIAWRRFDEIPHGQERAWLYGVAFHVLGNQHRGARRRRRLGVRLAQRREDRPVDPESASLRAEDQQRLRSAYLCLSSDDQEVLRLAAWEDLTHEQIGIVLGCSPSAARQRLHRARARLTQQLQREERWTSVLSGRTDRA